MIHIRDDWYIDADDRQVVLCRRTERVNGKTGEKEVIYLPKGYYTSLTGALLGYRDLLVRNRIHDGHYESVCEAIRAVTGANDEIRKLIEEVQG